MVEIFVHFAVGMAFQAGNALINVSPNVVMFVVHIILVVIVAINAGENTVIAGVGMTFGTADPFPVMTPRIHREILCIMQGVLGRPPVWFRGVTLFTVGRKVCGIMVWIGRGAVICLVTGVTLA
jgi:hypothetical protein